MSDEPDSVLSPLARASTPALPAALRQKTLALARSNLPPRGTRPRTLLMADYAPPRSLVPSLLISAATAFVVDAVVKVARLFALS
jgi:hypothetical protein